MFFLIVTMIFECQLRYPKTMVLYEGERLSTGGNSAYSVDLPAAVGGVLEDSGELVSDHYQKSFNMNETGVYDMTVKLFGVIPVRTVTVDVKPRLELAACGDTIGIKIFTKGLVCVGTQSVKDKNGRVHDPAKEADIRSGDIFLKVGQEQLSDTEQMAKAVQKSGGEALRFTVLRDEKELIKELTPTETEEGYKLGIWLRDSTAGIGTLTYYQPESLAFGALGHPISDGDTGTIMPVSDGELLSASVFSVEKGEKGEPGELKGIFKTQEPVLGRVTENSLRGVFGKLEQSLDGKETFPVASRNQIHEGDATILANVTGEGTEAFDVEIQRAVKYYDTGFKDMVIHVTDPRLLEKTGGIVQGMSGSPIIQNGKLVGAVTHVFVNDPTRGYGIFIENMLEKSE